MNCKLAALIWGALFSSAALPGDPDPLAEAFGAMPAMYGARLSPDGQKISYLSMAEADLPLLLVTDASGNFQLVLASDPNDFDLNWCDWVNNERLLCGYLGTNRIQNAVFPETRLVAVNSDGSKRRVLLQKGIKRRGELVIIQDNVVDWLPDDPEHVLIAMPDEDGTGVSRLNVYNGKTRVVERVRDYTWDWMTDGHGELRVRWIAGGKLSRWEYRVRGGEEWEHLHGERPGDNEHFYPQGFGDDRDELLVLQDYAARLALWAQPLGTGDPPRLVFAHDEVDLAGLLRVGKYRRIAGIRYVTDTAYTHYVDRDVAEVVGLVAQAKPGMRVDIADESWDRNVYLLHISQPNRPGRYYLLDKAAKRLSAFWPVQPQLEDRQLGPIQAHSYPARDGVKVPAYLTLPPNGADRDLPTIVLPHGGPASRDYMYFDFLAQYLAARGFAVLQANYRGSAGYGRDWSGEGAFKEWRQAIGDLIDGTRYLVDEGIADPDRICAVGWSYGGYAALLSALEAPGLFQCAVSIAGVTDLEGLVLQSRSRWTRAFIGTDDAVIEEGSPLHRVAEFEVPVLLFHGDRDANVKLKHSQSLRSALRKLDKQVDLFVYEDGDHSLRRSAYRTDLLDKLGAFLDEHTAPRTAAASN